MDILGRQVGQSEFLPKIEQSILWEIKKTNEYLQILIGLFMKAHPEIATESVNQEMQKIQKKKPPVGFK